MFSIGCPIHVFNLLCEDIANNKIRVSSIPLFLVVILQRYYSLFHITFLQRQKAHKSGRPAHKHARHQALPRYALDYIYLTVLSIIVHWSIVVSLNDTFEYELRQNTNARREAI